VFAGERLLVGDYRLGKAEAITYRDKSGKTANAVVLRHTLECGNDVIAVSVFADDSVKAETWKPPFAKGTKVVVRLESLVIDKGTITVRGDIQPLES